MLGFPIRKSSDHSSVDSSPRHIAASHVLHRLLAPRHPPCALRHLQHTKHTPNPRQPESHHNPDAPFMTSSAKKHNKMLTQKHVKLQKHNTDNPHKRARSHVDARVHYTILKQHTPPHRHQPTPPEGNRGTPAQTRSSKQRRRVLSDTQQCADETPPTGRTGQAGDKNYRVSVPPNNMSNHLSHIRADKWY